MKLNRRSFLKKSTVAAGSCMFSSFAIGKPGQSANSKVNVAFIGLGPQGCKILGSIATIANVVGLCDVNDKAFKGLPAKRGDNDISSVPRFKDLRVMLDKLGKDIDAVVVCTPDHGHFWSAYSAMERGKHVFVEKPLTHTVWEARKLREAAHKFKLVTQTGNFGRASEGIRRIKEWYDSGVLGQVLEVHGVIDQPGKRNWTNENWKLGGITEPPKELDWDLWLGSNPEVPYRQCYSNWRYWWAYGSGMIGDWGPHTLDGANYTLDMGAPVAVESEVSTDHSNGLRTPNRSHTVLHYPARGKKAPMKVHWHTGGHLPKNKELTLPSNGAGLLLVGEKHTLQADLRSRAQRIISMKDEEWEEFKRNMPPASIPRVKGGHTSEWIRAIAGDGPMPGANFDDSGPFTEALMLAAICERVGGKRLEWDSKNMRITNDSKLNEYVNQPTRKGFDCGRS
jgi:predicted dehydrogenase